MNAAHYQDDGLSFLPGELRNSLREIYSLLQPGGVFILTEGVLKSDYASFIYGLSGGWWAFQDPQLRIAGSPFSSLAQWKTLLEELPFKAVFSLHQLLGVELALNQDVIIALR